jgi:hypothetical protein
VSIVGTAARRASQARQFVRAGTADKVPLLVRSARLSA